MACVCAQRRYPDRLKQLGAVCLGIGKYDTAAPHLETTMQHTYDLAFLGAGNLAEAIVRRLIDSGFYHRERIAAFDPNEARRALFRDELGVTVVERADLLATDCPVLVLAIKPQNHAAAVAPLDGVLTDEHLVISVMAGVSTATIERELPHAHPRVVRVMPNLPYRLGDGIAGICGGAQAHAEDVAHVERIFNAGGKSIVVANEAMMDLVTAVAGSGPAYFYRIAEVLIASAIKYGLTPEQADVLVKQTCLGAARMMLETGERPEILRQRVTSPGGTTQAAFEVLEPGGIADLFDRAIQAAVDRGRELGR